MEILHIKFLDPVIYANKFFTEKEITKLASKTVEAVGYKIHETDTSSYFCNNSTSEEHKRILCISKNAVIDAQTVVSTQAGKLGEIIEVSYHEPSQTTIGAVVNPKNLQNFVKHSITTICGFLIFEDTEVIAIAVEKNQDGNYRTITVIPRVALIK